MAETTQHEGLSKTREMENERHANNEEPSELPAYQDVNRPTHSAESSSRPPHEEPPPTSYILFPETIYFYRADYFSLILGPPYEKNKARPPGLFYVSIHMDKAVTNKSEIAPVRLHSGPTADYPVMGEARFRMSPRSDLKIFPAAFGDKGAKILETDIELSNDTVMTSDTHYFCMNFEDSSGSIVRRMFEWKHSGGPEVKAIATDDLEGECYSQVKRGLKLVDPTTQKIYAVYSGAKHNRNLNPQRLAGKLRFIGEETEGLAFQLTTIMSILCLQEKKRREAAMGTGYSSGPINCTVC